MRAKPTKFKGILFRSHLEAKWAAFFDALPVVWEYEPRWFNLPKGNYLPDFRVVYPYRHTEVWCEVKPYIGDVTPEQWAKYEAFEGHLFMLDGPPAERKPYNYPWWFTQGGGRHETERQGSVLWSRRENYQGTYWGELTKREYRRQVQAGEEQGFAEWDLAIRASLKV
jgi:hypothetical protein